MPGSIPSILIAGVSSGCGKTTVTLGIMAALKEMGVEVQPFKCGPDFIDPTLHRMVTGRTSWNLDIRMTGPGYVKDIFCSKASRKGINIVEGVMGLFDGGRASSASLARLLGIPVILVVDASSAAESIAAVVKGFESIDPRVEIPGIILNNVASNRHLELIEGAVSRSCTARIVGVLDRRQAVKIKSRHLGLFMGTESPLGDNLSGLASWISRKLAMQAIIRISRTARVTENTREPFLEAREACRGLAKVPLGIARDRAFCFYYQDNLELLEIAGAELVPFSPIEDDLLPKGIRGIYLGGGYPELHAQALADNSDMRREIRAFSAAGMAVFAECGGFMYLCKSIIDTEGRSYKMAGVFPAETVMQERLAALGYRSVTLREACMLGSAGDRLHGHEFHYSSTRMSGNVDRIFSLSNGRKEGYRLNNTIAGYVHLHLGMTWRAAVNLVDACRAAPPWRT